MGFVATLLDKIIKARKWNAKLIRFLFLVECISMVWMQIYHWILQVLVVKVLFTKPIKLQWNIFCFLYLYFLGKTNHQTRSYCTNFLTKPIIFDQWPIYLGFFIQLSMRNCRIPHILLCLWLCCFIFLQIMWLAYIEIVMCTLVSDDFP